ncbi:MAG: PhoU domain-containing protein, partial [Peptostreptococcaceae bacterium]
ELIEMSKKVKETYETALEALEKGDVNLALKVIKMEEQVDAMELSYRKSHMLRLNEGVCSIDTGVIYLDVISNLERISDHSVNIATQVITSNSAVNESVSV